MSKMPKSIDDRLALALEQLELVNGILRTPLYIEGLFADLAASFNPADFRFDEGTLTQGYGNVWYQVEQLLEKELPSRDTFLRRAQLPLPEWAKEIQLTLLLRLCQPDAYGWAAELFWSQDENATLGIHVDNDDVYTVQLHGVKHWQVDPIRLDWLKQEIEAKRIFREGPWEAWNGLEPQTLKFFNSARFVMRPGDFLALPAFALHQVHAVTGGCNLSFNASICQEQAWQRFLTSGNL
jgi:Cupin superfamily protein